MRDHLGSLDGIRGGLALWVFWGHLANAVGWGAPILRAPALAVDLFMLLSGFLMAWNWQNRKQSLDRRTFGAYAGHFWIRRLFRIAPLYFPMLLLALCCEAPFIAARDLLMAVYRPAWSLGALTSPDSGANLFSAANLFAHLTFVFGLIPKYAANDALPDWSLSLEMQFYFVFPLLVWFCRAPRILLLTVGSMAVAVLTARFVEVGPSASLAPFHFPQPSLLPLKLHIFVAGMALGGLLASPAKGSPPLSFWLSFIAPMLLLPKPVILGAIVISALLLNRSSPVRALARLLGSRPFRIAGDLSYGVYLIHYLPSYLALAFAVRRGYFVGLSPAERFGLAALALTIPIYLAAYTLHLSLERPGIRLGRHVSDAFVAWQLGRASRASPI